MSVVMVREYHGSMDGWPVFTDVIWSSWGLWRWGKMFPDDIAYRDVYVQHREVR